MNIVLIGVGNVGTNLIFSLIGCETFKTNKIIQIYSRNLEKVKHWVRLFDAEIVDKIEKINRKADLYLFMLPDDVVFDFVSEMEPTNAVFVHTSGSLPISVFKEKTPNCGALYPFQTFSKDIYPYLNSKIPIFIEASNPETYKKIKQFADFLQFKNITKVSEKKRNIIHLAGIFANNLTNHCIYLAEEILTKNNIDRNILLPLFEETTKKIKSLGAEQSQTGPARRNDIKIVEKHLKMLKNNSEMFDIYKTITNSILKTYHNEKNKRF